MSSFWQNYSQENIRTLPQNINIRMKNLASFRLALLIVYTVNAQSHVDWPTYNPFVSSPHYHYNRDVLPTRPKAPVIHQNADQHVLYRDAIVSVMLQQLKENSKRLAETNEVVANVKRQVTELQNELAQIKKSAEEKEKAEMLKSQSNEKLQNANKTTTLAQFVASKLGNSTLDYNDGGAPTARFCNCLLFQQMTSILGKDMAETKVKLNDLTAQINANISPKTIGKIPTSCGDLKQLGYKNSGIYSVKGNKRVQSVYCDFTKPDIDADFEKVIGIVDVKTTRVSFHAQRGSSYAVSKTAVPFDLLLTNEGNAMTASTGNFVAPTPGTYFFAYSGVTLDPIAVRVDLQMKTATTDWVHIGQAYGSVGSYETYALQATLLLRKGDQIRLYLTEGTVFDNDRHFTNFVGFLLEEELVQVYSGINK